MTALSYSNLVDIDQIRELLEAHYKITGVGAGILDTEENIIVAVGYHDICTRFHLVHPLAKLNCRESDAYIKAHLSNCKDGYLDYRCKNGLVDVAVPIIIRGKHLATFFTGQFFYDDDRPDVEYFRKQAENFGFDETGYLEALGHVPVFTREHIHKIVEYYRHLVRIIAGMGLKNLELRNGATERNQAEESLRKSRQMLMSVLDNFPGVVFWKDRNSVYMGCNKNFSLAAGLSEPSEIVGRRDYDLPWKNDAERYLADDRQVIESGAPKLNIIETLLHADGRVAWFETSKVPLFDEDGKVFAVLGASNDITERKRAEEALRKAYDDLESRVKERTEQLTSLTAELSLAEERERRRIATELHDQVGQTLILSKIKLDSLSRSLPSESFGKQIGEITKYLDQSIQDIRSLTFQLSPPLLYEVGFEAAVEWLGEEFEEKYGLQVEFQDDGRKKPLAEEASVALYQMVRELLLNVAKHAKAKRVRISIGKTSGKIKVIVADDGSGFGSLNGMRRKNKRSGFGLFNIRQRIEYLGGDLTIESEIGCGTRATLSLPLKKKTQPPQRGGAAQVCHPRRTDPS